MDINIILSETAKILKVEKLPQAMINDLRNVGRWNNPDYYKKKNMGFYVRGIPKLITARTLTIEDDESRTLTYERGLWPKLSSVFSRYQNLGITLKVKKHLVSKKIAFPPFKLKLEEYQEHDLDLVLNGPAQGIISYPTGGGKTIIAAALLGKLNQRTLICVHTRDLANQWKEVLTKKCFDNLSVSMIGGGKLDFSGQHVVIGTVQTLKNLTDSDDFQSFGCIILDECHHVSAPSFIDVVGKSKAKYRYGLSATLKRQDGKDFLLEAVFGNTLVELTYKDIESRVELPVVYKINFNTQETIPMDVYSIRKDQEYLNMVEMHKFLASDERRTDLITSIAGSCMQNPLNSVLILVKLREHATTLFDSLDFFYPGQVGLLMGGHSKAYQKEKEEIIKKANEGKIRILIGTSIADEGLDIARLNVLIMAAPASFDGLIKQRMGRIIRKHPDKGDPVIYDIVDAQIPEMLGFWRKREKLYRSIDIEIRESV